MNNSIYSTVITSKTGVQLPLLQNGKSIESRYNPEREAESQLLQFEKNTAFFLVIGIGSGILIKKMLEAFPHAKIIALENSQADIEFLTGLSLIKEIQKSERVIFTCTEKLNSELCKNYIPALHGNLKIYENRVWVLENRDFFQKIQDEINKALAQISSDFSVQAHFGKIWQSNIMKNLKLASKISSKTAGGGNKNKAAVIAAGPSFDETINLLLKHDDYYIISTDTAFSTLLKYGLIPDAVISLDGQTVSFNHYLHKNLKQLNQTEFYFDLSANFSAAKKISDNKLKLFYFTSGHPLSSAARSFSENKIINLYSGSGTVTITAVDLAVKKGFSQIDLFGADFSYSKGKAYTKGTYLEGLYQIWQTKIFSYEKFFDSLMFRTELIKKDFEHFSSPVLESYKDSLENYLKSMNLSYVNSDNLYRITLKKSSQESKSEFIEKEIPKFNYEGFIKKLKSGSESDYVFLLPYIAWLRKKMNFTDCKFEDLHKLASQSLLSYN